MVCATKRRAKSRRGHHGAYSEGRLLVVFDLIDHHTYTRAAHITPHKTNTYHQKLLGRSLFVGSPTWTTKRARFRTPIVINIPTRTYAYLAVVVFGSALALHHPVLHCSLILDDHLRPRRKTRYRLPSVTAIDSKSDRVEVNGV